LGRPDVRGAIVVWVTCSLQLACLSRSGFEFPATMPATDGSAGAGGHVVAGDDATGDAVGGTGMGGMTDLGTRNAAGGSAGTTSGLGGTVPTSVRGGNGGASTTGTAGGSGSSGSASGPMVDGGMGGAGGSGSADASGGAGASGADGGGTAALAGAGGRGGAGGAASMDACDVDVCDVDSAVATDDASASDGAAGMDMGEVDGGTCIQVANCTCESYVDHKYLFCSNTLSQSEARAQCQAAGMDLARIDSEAENTWITDTCVALGLFSKPNTFMHIGASDAIVEGTWQWTDGTVFWIGDSTGSPIAGLYSNWRTSHPSLSTLDNCAMMRPGGTWVSRACESAVFSLCRSP
jgi:hypothetical protein